MIEKMPGWRTSDGKVFSDRREASVHEAKAALVRWVEQYAPNLDAEVLISAIAKDPIGFSDATKPMLDKRRIAPTTGKRRGRKPKHQASEVRETEPEAAATAAAE